MLLIPLAFSHLKFWLIVKIPILHSQKMIGIREIYNVTKMLQKTLDVWSFYTVTLRQLVQIHTPIPYGVKFLKQTTVTDVEFPALPSWDHIKESDIQKCWYSSGMLMSLHVFDGYSM